MTLSVEINYFNLFLSFSEDDILSGGELPPGAVFTEAKSLIIDPGLNQRRQFCPDYQFF
jgi:hypothetical protein